MCNIYISITQKIKIILFLFFTKMCFLYEEISTCLRRENAQKKHVLKCLQGLYILVTVSVHPVHRAFQHTF